MRELTSIRVSSGITQPDLAEVLGYGWKQLSQMETGARALYLQRVEDYANYFGYELVLQKKGQSHDPN
jgi:transcriptional regulator with XRE-family HTH domain